MRDCVDSTDQLTTEMGEQVEGLCRHYQPADHRNGRTTRLRDCVDSTDTGGGGGDLDNLGTTKVCLSLHQEMELLGCYNNFIKNQIF